MERSPSAERKTIQGLERLRRFAEYILLPRPHYEIEIFECEFDEDLMKLMKIIDRKV